MRSLIAAFLVVWVIWAVADSSPGLRHPLPLPAPSPGWTF